MTCCKRLGVPKCQEKGEAIVPTWGKSAEALLAEDLDECLESKAVERRSRRHSSRRFCRSDCQRCLAKQVRAEDLACSRMAQNNREVNSLQVYDIFTRHQPQELYRCKHGRMYNCHAEPTCRY